MSGQEMVFGLHAVEAMLKHNPETIRRLYIDAGRRDPRITRISQLAEQLQIALERVERQELDRMCPGEAKHQGVVARCHPAGEKDEAFLEQLLDSLTEPPFLLILDGVQDPHNLGACLRTADAAGVQALIVPKDRAAGLNATVRKVASGAAESVPFVQVTNLARTLRGLQERGIWLVGTAGEADTSLYQQDLRGPLAVVMGAEGQGLRRLTKEHCDHLVHIPMQGTVESLNVSVATGICLFEARRQRG